MLLELMGNLLLTSLGVEAQDIITEHYGTFFSLSFLSFLPSISFFFLIFLQSLNCYSTFPQAVTTQREKKAE